MTPIEILEKIIENNGSCEWVNKLYKEKPHVCDVCPLGNDEFDSCRSCIAYLSEKFSGCDPIIYSTKMNKLFLKIAKEKLLDLLTEEMLVGVKK